MLVVAVGCWLVPYLRHRRREPRCDLPPQRRGAPRWIRIAGSPEGGGRPRVTRAKRSVTARSWSS
jgi:hypothetical protein